ncbi:MAG: hypothetical protein KJ548_15300 [Actinobacteria bacterium]|jgi:hypothetical protein|nr:hypothetical protein [Actinomycetota bacterium]MBU4337928.1 hypothetical protein [Actinomycetota bacterium]MBU4401009.1 hypothetical protein [Planctomycetota bacterium]PKN21784.1 MAG: hypothetical protein CVU68_06380 [Deltaproteobacteria bacterium HGW-Deltaproteobacteria-3]
MASHDHLLQTIPVTRLMGCVDTLPATGMSGHLLGQLKFQLQAVQLTDIEEGAILGCLAKGAFDEQAEKAHGKQILLVVGMHWFSSLKVAPV